MIAELASRLRRVAGATGAFSHRRAQRYEKAHATATIRESWPPLHTRWTEAVTHGSLWHTADDPWFQNDQRLFDEFVEYVRPRRCLEVGSGPFGWLGPASWIHDRWIVDPLIDFYHDEELRVAGATFFDDPVRRIAVPAEEVVQELVGTVDGAIVCRNALDHAEDPMAILNNLSDYAAPGCFLLFWTDLWHLEGPDAGHRNITRSTRAMDRFLKGLGFNVLKASPPVRGEPERYLEYGVLARKGVP